MSEDYDKIDYWIEASEYDISTAKAMLKTRRVLYIGFMAHMAVEKMLKAAYVNKERKVPPYTHNLKQLADLSGMELSAEHLHFIATLMPLNIEARYPKRKEMLYKSLDKKKSRDIIKEAEALCKWIQKQLKL